MTLVESCHLALTRKTTALMAVTDRTKLNTRAEIMAGRISGSTIRRTVVANDARNVTEASSSALSICASAAMPLRIPTGMFRKMKEITRMSAVPVSRNGDWLKARTMKNQVLDRDTIEAMSEEELAELILVAEQAEKHEQKLETYIPNPVQERVH